MQIIKIGRGNLKPHLDTEEYKDYLYKGKYLFLESRVQDYWAWHGMITLDKVREMIGNRNFSKFKKGRKEFKTNYNECKSRF